MPPKYVCAIALLLLMFSASSGLAQPTVENLTPRYVEAPQPRCDAYTMQNRANLSALEKTCYYRDQMISPSATFGAGFFAGIAQAMDSPREWPQGAKGFGWRSGTRYVQGMSKTTGAYLTGLMLREDPRVLRPDCDRKDPWGMVSAEAAPRTVWKRLAGAVAVNFWAKNFWDNNGKCKARPVFAPTVGALSSGFVGMAWTPDSSNTIAKAFVRSGTALGGTIGNRVFSEFQGDLVHFFTRSGPKSKPAGGSK
jgi:hypothetical protein